MRNPNFEAPQKSKSAKYFKIYSIVAALIFMGAGVFILLSPDFFGGLSRNQSQGFGILLLLYGMFRFYKAIKTKSKN